MRLLQLIARMLFQRKKPFSLITVERVDSKVIIVTLCERRSLSESQREILAEELFSLIPKEGRKHILIDWSNVEYYNSGCVPLLVQLNQKVKKTGGRLVFCKIPKSVLELFQIMKLELEDMTLDQYFTIKKDRKDGLSVFMPQ